MHNWDPADLERFFLRAWPARVAVTHNGYIVRAHDGYTGRANSATVMQPALLSPSGLVRVEAFYRRLDLRPKFRLLSFTSPTALDLILAARGYRRHSPTLVMGRPMREFRDNFSALVPLPLVDWLVAYALCHGRKPAAPAQAAHGQILAEVDAPLLTAVLLEEGEPVACGAAVAAAGWCALFDIAVRPAWRRRGLGGALLEGLLAWGITQGSHYAALQVEMNNRPALRFYRRFDFRAHYYYWYRTADAVQIGNR